MRVADANQHVIAITEHKLRSAGDLANVRAQELPVVSARLGLDRVQERLLCVQERLLVGAHVGLVDQAQVAVLSEQSRADKGYGFSGGADER